MCYVYPDNLRQTCGSLNYPITNMKFQPIAEEQAPMRQRGGKENGQGIQLTIHYIMTLMHYITYYAVSLKFNTRKLNLIL